MKAPSKIYAAIVDNQLDASFLKKSIGEKKYPQFVRKDLLLEWAKKELETRRNTGDDYYLPAIVVLNDLIEKLNSL